MLSLLAVLILPQLSTQRKRDGNLFGKMNLMGEILMSRNGLGNRTVGVVGTMSFSVTPTDIRIRS